MDMEYMLTFDVHIDCFDFLYLNFISFFFFFVINGALVVKNFEKRKRLFSICNCWLVCMCRRVLIYSKLKSQKKVTQKPSQRAGIKVCIAQGQNLKEQWREQIERMIIFRLKYCITIWKKILTRKEN